MVSTIIDFVDKRGEAFDGKGRRWLGRVVERREAEEEDFSFWFDGLSPVERVEAVDECLSSALKTKGRHGPGRLRRFFEVVQFKRR
jgi:hypothetical protein